MHRNRFSLDRKWVLASLILIPILAVGTWARTEKVLYTFTGGNDGGLPVAGLIMDKSGNLYGTTSGGGNPACQSGLGCGTVFELTANSGGGWSETVLYTFTGGSDGYAPEAALVSDSKGNLYGVAELGGSSACTYPLGCGTVFELTPNGDSSWSETTIYSFTGRNDGQNPNASLIFDGKGNLYGTTFYGGVESCFADVGCGTVFELTPSANGWTETVLHRFTGGKDGAFLRGGLFLNKAGALFGTTEQGGGTGCYSRGCGSVFRLRPSNGGWVEWVLYRFSGSSDGAFPQAGLIRDAAGNLYGTTEQGGDTNCGVPGGWGGCGAVFRMSYSRGEWTQTVLYGFTAEGDGNLPEGGLILYKGNLYGTTYQGGDNGCYEGQGCGAVFELKHSDVGWGEKVLHRFKAGNDGEYPIWGSLIVDREGNLYGTTNNGGAYGSGNIFEIIP